MLTQSVGISVVNECDECIAGINLVSVLETKEVMCVSCHLDSESRSDEMAWNHRADERLAEGDVIRDLGDVPVGSDWISSETRRPDGKIRSEFTPPINNLMDRCPSTYFLGQHIFDLDEDEGRSKIHMFEIVCPSCNLVWSSKTGCMECI